MQKGMTLSELLKKILDGDIQGFNELFDLDFLPIVRELLKDEKGCYTSQHLLKDKAKLNLILSIYGKKEDKDFFSFFHEAKCFKIHDDSDFISLAEYRKHIDSNHLWAKLYDTYKEKDLVIPNGIEEITSNVLEELLRSSGSSREKLKKVSFSNSLKFVGDNCFLDFINLEKVVLNEGLVSLGKSSFENTGITRVAFPKTLRTVDKFSFMDCQNLKEVEFNEGLESLHSSAFNNSGVQKIVLPSTLRSLGEECFMNCQSLEEVEFKEGLSSLSSHAFSHSGLKKIVFPATL